MRITEEMTTWIKHGQMHEMTVNVQPWKNDSMDVLSAKHTRVCAFFIFLQFGQTSQQPCHEQAELLEISKVWIH